MVSAPQREQLARVTFAKRKGSRSSNPNHEIVRSAPINSRHNVVVQSPTPFGLSRNGCWTFRGSQLPRAFPFIFSLCCPLNGHTRAAHSFLKIDCLFSLARLRLLILLLLLMSGNVHPNPGPIFLCSVWAGNVIWLGKSVQYCTCSKWVHLKCSQLSLSKFRTLDSSHSWSCPPPCRVPTRNTVTLSSDSSDMYTSTVQSSLSSANAAFPPHPRLQIFSPPWAHFVSSPFAHSPPSLAPGFCASCLLSPLTLSGFSNGMLEVFEPGALNYFTFFRPILLTLSVSRNPIFTHLPLSRFQDSLFCALIAPTPGLAFSLLMPRTLAAVSSFSSDRAYHFLNFLPLFLHSIATLIMQGSTSLLTTPLLSHFLMSTLPLFAPLQRMAESFAPSILSSRNLFILVDFNCHHPLWDTRGTSDSCGEEVFDWVISFDLLPLNDFDIPTLLHRSSGSCSSPDIFFAPSSLALSCSWEVLQDLGSNHLSILLSVPLFPVFRPTSVPLSSTVRKFSGMTLPPTLTPTVLLQRSTRLSLFLVLLLFLTLWH